MSNLKLILGLFAGTVIYSYLMWYQDLGVNAFIFALLLVNSIFIYKKEVRANSAARYTAAAFLLSAAFVGVNGIVYGKVMYYLSMIVFLSFAQLSSLRSLCWAVLSAVANVRQSLQLECSLIVQTAAQPFENKNNKTRSGKNWEVLLIRIAIVSLLLIIFLAIFLSANAQFNKLWMNIFNPIVDFLSKVFSHISFFDIFHFLFIFYFLSLFFLPFQENTFAKYDRSFQDNFVRTKKKFYERFYKKGLSVDLKNEYKTALLCFIALNILLLCVNLTDMFSVWMGKIPSTNELSSFVHTGTYLLIYSVLLSAGIMLYFFRENLNLYSKNKYLKYAANVWIIQNTFLLLSTGLRNYYYITQCGLTYKRIGVYIFLIIVLLSLLYLFIKINHKKTFYYYYKMCCWELFSVLVVSGFFNWDVIICKYNTAFQKENMDYNYMESLSQQALSYTHNHSLNIKENDSTDVSDFIDEVQNRNWQSFNLGDYWAAKKLK